jgi:hypothetical protein
MIMQPLTDVQRQMALRLVGADKARPDPLIGFLRGMRASLGFAPPASAEVLNPLRARAARAAFMLQAEIRVLESLGPP